jgi:hypothetical protein
MKKIICIIFLITAGLLTACSGSNGSDGASSPSVNWVNVTGTAAQAQPNTGYLANNQTSEVVITLPLTSSLLVGDIIQVSGIGAGGWKVAQNAGQSNITENIPECFGAVWTPRGSNRFWLSVASSADGTKIAAVVYNGQIYTSTDSGATWTPRDSNRGWI